MRQDLSRIRWEHAGFESAEEDRTLDEMDEVWMNLTDEDRARCEELPPVGAPLATAEELPFIDRDPRTGPVRELVA